jgi:hypothetical protein
MADREHQPPEEVDQMPGCGLAAYTLLLAVVGVVGTVGMLASMYAMAVSTAPKAPAPLVGGHETPVWALSPMRKARLVEVDEVPLAFHDESDWGDATVACALMADRLVKVDGETGATLPYQAIRAVRAEGDEDLGITVHAEGPDQTISCRFRANEGGDNMARQLQAEVDRAQR